MYFLLYIFLLFLFNKIYSADKLIFVMTHFRHGARAPQYFYSKYVDYVYEKWENPGELTGIGQRMHYLLGIRNRIRYINENNFLSEKFNPHEMLIYSSCLNRTINSVSSQLQGLYPQFIKQGETLTEKQEEYSKPQVNIDYDIITEEIKNLNKSALPNSMILAPVRMINKNERKIRFYDTEGCKTKANEIRKKNAETLESLINIVKKFNDNYGETLNKFYGKNESYNISFLDNFCDAYIASYTDQRDMLELHKTEINFEELIGFCYEYQKLSFRDWLLGDDKHSIAHLEVSVLMKEFIHYMKQRIDADIKKEDIDSHYEDYSKPKMMMISGHDTTLSCFEIFLMEALQKDIDFYKYPDFAAQMAFEVTTNENNEDGKNYNNYFVNYYFNDEHLFNITVEDFINKMTPHIWSDKQINDYCGFDQGNNNSDDNNKKDNKDLILILLIISSILAVVFIITTIILSICLIKNKKNELINNPLIPEKEELKEINQ